MTVFADSSALVKIYVLEEGSAEVESLDSITVSALCRVEILSALWRKSNDGQIDGADAGLLSRMFESDLFGQSHAGKKIASIPVSDRILEDAAKLVPIHALKSLDAIQLASALAAREADPGCQKFACFDQKLGTAARTHGFELIPSS